MRGATSIISPASILNRDFQLVAPQVDCPAHAQLFWMRMLTSQEAQTTSAPMHNFRLSYFGEACWSRNNSELTVVRWGWSAHAKYSYIMEPLLPQLSQSYISKLEESTTTRGSALQCRARTRSTLMRYQRLYEFLPNSPLRDYIQIHRYSNAILLLDYLLSLSSITQTFPRMIPVKYCKLANV